MAAKIINFPSDREERPSGNDEAAASPTLKPGIEIDRELDRALRGMEDDDPVRLALQYGTGAVAFSNVFRLLRRRPEELLIFCNTIVGDCETGVPWGDVYCLTDEDVYRYIFTLYTASYVRECQLRRGEMILPSAEAVILPVPDLRQKHLTEGMAQWVREYYPGLAGLPVRLEDPHSVREMIADAMEVDPDP